MSDSTRTASQIADPAAPQAGATAHQAGANPRPIQYSLWSLMALMTFLAVVLSAATGGLGEFVRDATRFFLLVFTLAFGAVAFVFVVVSFALLMSRR